MIVAVSEPSLPLRSYGRRGEPRSQVSAGINSVAKKISLNTRRKIALLAAPEMLITTLIADAPGVMGVDGLNLHCAPEGRPLAHARVTGALNEAPIG